MFNKKRSPNDIINAELYAQVAEAATLAKTVYDDGVARLLRKQGYMAVKFCDSDGAQAVCCVKDNVAYVAFRGTQPDKRNDIIADLKFWRRDSKLGGSVHVGFQDEVLKIEDDIRAWLKKNTIKSYIITGHSLGGAMATIFAARQDASKINKVITFGSPRVGGSDFVKAFNQQYEHIRVVNNNDIVTRVPPAPLYRHTGISVYYDHKDNCFVNPSRLKKIQCWFTGFWHAVKKGNFADMLTDHNIATYEYLVENTLDDF